MHAEKIITVCMQHDWITSTEVVKHMNTIDYYLYLLLLLSD